MVRIKMLYDPPERPSIDYPETISLSRVPCVGEAITLNSHIVLVSLIVHDPYGPYVAGIKVKLL